jgi:hypothetical protein
MRALLVRFCLAFLFIPLFSARADLMYPLAVEDLSTNSQFILHGKVISTTVQRDAAQRIYTKIDLQVMESWKGAVATNHFTIVHSGGILGDEVATASGEAAFDVGEEVVAFLVTNKLGEGVCIGMSQGKFHVWADPATGEKFTHNHFHGLHPDLPNNATTPQTTKIINRLTLSDLKQRVQKASGGAQ